MGGPSMGEGEVHHLEVWKVRWIGLGTGGRLAGWQLAGDVMRSTHFHGGWC